MFLSCFYHHQSQPPSALLLADRRADIHPWSPSFHPLTYHGPAQLRVLHWLLTALRIKAQRKVVPAHLFRLSLETPSLILNAPASESAFRTPEKPMIPSTSELCMYSRFSWG